LEVLNRSQLSAVTDGIGDAGNVEISAQDRVTFSGADGQFGSSALSSVGALASGSGGDVKISTNSLEILNGASIRTSTFGSGNSGNVLITARDSVLFDGTSPDGQFSSGAFIAIASSGLGSGGNVEIISNSLEVTNGAQLAVRTAGFGDGGNIIIQARESVLFDGTSTDGQFSSAASSTVESDALGNAGNIEIAATNLEVTNGAQLVTNVLGAGNGGSIRISLSETARFDGFNPVANSSSGAFSVISPGSFGDGGDVILFASNLEVVNGAQLNATTFGDGNAGNISILVEETARFDGFNFSNSDSDFSLDLIETEIVVGDNSSSSNFSIITASVRGFRGLDNSGSSALSSVEAGGSGFGGNVWLQANDLEIINGARVGTLNAGIGDAGDIIITSENATIDGFNDLSGSPSGVVSIIQGGTGNSGNIKFQVSSLSVTNGAQISTAPFGEGIAGNIEILVEKTAHFSGFNILNEAVSGVFSNLPFINSENGSDSLGGNIALLANRLEVFDNAALSTSSFGDGESGSISIELADGLFMKNGTIETASSSASGGGIEITANNVFLQGDSDIQTFVLAGVEGAGDIIINAILLLAFDDSDILAFSADGTGGNVFLNVPVFFGENFEATTQLNTLEGLQSLDGNERVDINATGGVASGDIIIPDVSFVGDNLTAFEDNIVDISSLTAGSCIVRTADDQGSFVVTGRDGLPQRPGDTGIAAYPTGSESLVV
jgi:large exoprotein involved in heme utilization and adhesion